MTQTPTIYQFTIEQAVQEWLQQKRVSKSNSEKTNTAYRDTLQSFRWTLQHGGLDLFSDPVEVARVATFWAAQRSIDSKRKGNVSDSTYNQRLACVSSFYSFCKKQYKRNTPNPIEDVDKRHVQAYAYAIPLDPDSIDLQLQSIDTSTIQGKRDYALLALGLTTGRRASELVGLRWGHVRYIGKTAIFEFHCKGKKVQRNTIDEDLAALIMEYLQLVYGNLRELASDAPLWVSLSKRNMGQAISTHTLNDLCMKVLGTTKIHSLRHTFAKEMEKDGATLTEIQHALGHEDPTITTRYLKELNSGVNIHTPALARRFGIAKKAKSVR